MPEIKCLESRELMGIYQNVRDQEMFLSQVLATGVIKSEKERIEFDFKEFDYGMAPFVRPCDEGLATIGQGWSTKWFRPAYVKLKDALNVCDNCPSWYAGERPYSSLSLRQKFLIERSDILRRHSIMIKNRLEWTVSKLATTGGYSIAYQGSTGNEIQRFNMSYGRNPALNHTVPILWNQATATPMSDMESMINKAGELSRGTPAVVVMGRDVYSAMVKHEDVNDLNNATARLNSTVFSLSTPSYTPQGGARRHGMFNGIDYWTYTGQYRDANGALQYYVPANMIMVICRPDDVPVMTKFYGAIKDLASLRPVEVFQKEWIENDPSAMQLLTQQAPLVGSINPNCILTSTVLP